MAKAKSKKGENVLITSAGIKNSLKRYKPLQALSEFVWNGFDAQASRVDISICEDFFNPDAIIEVKDNGTGIDYSLLSNKFKPFFQSEKIYNPEDKHSAAHGKNGVGRLTFFTFANYANWETVYCRDDQFYSYRINIHALELQEYNPGDEVKCSASAGTTVTFSDLNTTDITVDAARQYLAKEFCWFLELNKEKGYSICINGEILDYRSYIANDESVNYKNEQTGTEFSVRYVCWNIRISDYSRYYFLKSDGSEVTKETTTLNNKGDHFYHSVYIKSDFFDSFDAGKIVLNQIGMKRFNNKKSPDYFYIMDEVNRHLYDMRRPFIKESVSKVIESLEIESAFPDYNPKNPIDQHRKSEVSDMISAIYLAQPKMFTGAMNKEQKKTFVRLLDFILTCGEVQSLFDILGEILDMTEDERRDLSDILKYARLSNISKTIRLIKDRYQAIYDLKQLVFNKDLHANEIIHLQSFIEEHYWLFGEQYHLVTAAEPNFEEGLRRYLHYLHREYEEATIDHPDKLKQMDILAVRQAIDNGSYENIVVELKHPDISLGEVQLSQVKRYMRVITKTSPYNGSNMSWSFYLVGNRFTEDRYIQSEMENCKSYGIPFLVFKMANYSIYVMTWSEVFSNFEMRYSHLNERLKLEKEKLMRKYFNANDVLEAQNESTAKMPGEMPPSKMYSSES